MRNTKTGRLNHCLYDVGSLIWKPPPSWMVYMCMFLLYICTSVGYMFHSNLPWFFFPESMRVLPAELFVRTAAKNCLEDDSLIGTTSATINFKSIAHKHPTSSQITKSITSRGLPAFWLLPSRKDQLYGTPNLWPFCNDPNCFFQIPHHVP